MKSGQNGQMSKIDDHVYTPQKALLAEYKADRNRRYTCLVLVCYDVDELAMWLGRTRPASYAYIMHDKDINKDGSPKEVHYHCIAKFSAENRVRLTSLRKAFKTSNVMVELPYDEVASYEYLTHKNAPDKYQYSEDKLNVFVRDGQIRVGTSAEEAKTNLNKEFFCDLQGMSKRELAYKYGRDYMKNSRTYHQFITDVQYDEEREEIYALAEEANLAVDELIRLGIDPSEFIDNELTKFFSKLMSKLKAEKRLLRYSDLTETFIDCQRFFVGEVRAYINGERYYHEEGGDY